MKVAFTRFDASKPVTKSYSLGDDGAIVKAAAAQMANAKAVRMECEFNDFGKVLDGLTAKQALGYGLHDAAQFGATAKVVVDEKAEPPKTIARTKQYFQYRQSPGILMLDHDPSPFGKAVTADELLAILAQVFPPFAKSPCWIRPSVSSGVRLAGVEPKPAKGFHIYFPVADASDIPRFGEAIFKRLVLAGHGFIARSGSGAALERSVIDGAVFSGERLDFAGRPVIGEGIEYDAPKARLRGLTTDVSKGVLDTALDTSCLPSLSDTEEADYKRIMAEAKCATDKAGAEIKSAWKGKKVAAMVDAGTPELEARRQVDRIGDGRTVDLPDGFLLEFANIGIVSVADVLACPARYDGKALADPVEGVEYGRTTAKFYANAGGTPCIHSQAHGAGTRYFLGSGKKTKPGSRKQETDSGNQEALSGNDEPPEWLVDGPDWDGMMEGDGGFELITVKGKAVSCAANVAHWLGGMDIAKNLFSTRYCIDREDFSDERYASLLVETQRRVRVNIAKDHLYDAVAHLCATNPGFHPVIDWIKAIPWDGKRRIDKFFHVCLGAENTVYHAAASRYLFLSAVERIRNPGSRVHCMVILEGGQGKFKSTAVTTLFGAKWHALVRASMTNNDFFQNMRGKWCMEFGEMSGFKDHSSAHIKDILSAGMDTYRKSYGRDSQDFPRQNIFIATTNETSNYLRDPTGDRRYLPVAVGDINIGWIEQSRDQLWAEAWHMLEVENVQGWWDVTGAPDAQELRKQTDPWEVPISSALEGRTMAIIEDLMYGTLNIPIKDHTQAQKNRVAAIMRRLGWSCKPEKVRGRGQVRIYRPVHGME